MEIFHKCISVFLKVGHIDVKEMMLNLISVTSLLLSSNLITSLMLCTALNQTFCVYLKICHAKWSDDYTYSSCWREEMWDLVNTISRAPRRCIILYRLDPALVEFTDDLQRPTETMLSAYVTNPQCRTHGHTASSWCLCVQCSVTSQQRWQQPQTEDWEEEGIGRRAQLCHLAGALLQNRLFLHSALLYAQLKVTRINQNTGWMFKLHPSPFLSDHFPPVFCIGFGGMWDCLLLAPSFKLNTYDDMLLLVSRPFLTLWELNELAL